MAKIYGLFGSMKGKVADVVLVVRNGVQIVRKYQPIVSNPSTQAQVEARAKLKLMSQLSAVMADVIAIPRVGNVSSRNLFTKINYKNATYAGNTASVNLAGIQLTKSVVGIPGVSVTRGEGVNVTAEMSGVLTGFDRVVYCYFLKQDDGALRFVNSTIVTNAGESMTYPWSTQLRPTENAVFYAYAIRDNNEAARAIFGNLQALTAEQVAKLIVTRNLLESDITMSETKGVDVAAVNAAVNPEPDDGNRSKKK